MRRFVWEARLSISHGPVQGAEKRVAASEIVKEMHDRWKERLRFHQVPTTGFSNTYKPFERTLSVLTFRAQTTDARDSLYAFYGLNEDGRIDLDPSSEAGHQLKDAVIYVTQSIIEGTKSLNIFEVARRKWTDATYSAIKGVLPSWAPDFRLSPRVAPFEFLADSPYRWRGSYDSVTLRTHGRAVDRIYRRLAALTNNATHSHYSEAHSHCNEEIRRAFATLSVQREKDTSKPRPAMERVLHASLAEGYCLLIPHLNSKVDLLVSTLQDPTHVQNTLHAYEHREPIRYTLDILSQVMRGRELWVTAQGRLATGSDLQSGDCLCILHGCTNPVALCETKESPKRYTVKGTC
jgi:hypothetical protein